jgi:hypothetical protein
MLASHYPVLINVQSFWNTACREKAKGTKYKTEAVDGLYDFFASVGWCEGVGYPGEMG